jgi:SAM-dependent methyltransferase
VLGDFSGTVVPGSFTLVCLLVNTIYALPDQAAQVECFRNAARHLSPGGRFVVEAWVPDPPPHGVPRARPRRLGPGFTGVVLEEHDRSTQTLATTQLVVGPDGEGLKFPVVHRYAWPSELDLMAQLAGLSLEHRWADWAESEFHGDSPDHISVWRRDG